jgi:hypothetical protein
MVALLHVLIALSSIVYAAYLLIWPSKNKLIAASSLVGLTIVSGTVLVITTHTPLMSVCTIGLVYLGGMSMALIISYYKMVRREAFDKTE